MLTTLKWCNDNNICGLPNQKYCCMKSYMKIKHHKKSGSACLGPI